MRQSLYRTASIEAMKLSRSQEGFFRGRNTIEKKLYPSSGNTLVPSQQTTSQDPTATGKSSNLLSTSKSNVKLKPLVPSSSTAKTTTSKHQSSSK